MSWSDADLRAFDATRELLVAAPRPDGTLPRSVPIWVVVAAGGVYVRTWHMRTNGWYGRAVASGRAVVAADGVDADVVVEVVGEEQAEAVDAAFDAKYGTGGGMMTDEAVATTLRLTRPTPQP